MCNVCASLDGIGLCLYASGTVQKTVVINCVGLTPSLIGPDTPRLAAFRDKGRLAPVRSVLPAVTTTVQATYLTGKWPSEHGIVGNGWYFRDECEVKFWRQSSHLVEQPRIWDIAGQMDNSFRCANLFWWYAMYSAANYTVTPRPMYPATGLKFPDVWTHPADLRDSLQKELGRFPLFKFWGPKTSIAATRWIADAAIRVDQKNNATLTLIYLPHLDYCLQRRGPDPAQSSKDLHDLDQICGKLIDHFTGRGARVVILSEYGITSVTRPVHLNRHLRERGLLAIREERGRELLDAGESEAFAVADHQVAHVYVNNLSRLSEVRDLIARVPGVETVLDHQGKRQRHLDHPRAGELVAIAAPDSWFTYYYWLDDARAPDFARTVDIHRKPGYDPTELFIDPKIKIPTLKAAWTLTKKMMGFRYLMELIPLQGDLVRGSHGRPAPSEAEGPLIMSDQAELMPDGSIEPTEVFKVLMRHLESE